MSSGPSSGCMSYPNITTISHQQVQKLTPQNKIYTPPPPKLFFFSKNVGNSIKREENMKWKRIVFLTKNVWHPPPPPTTPSHTPCSNSQSLLFGETTSHLTSKHGTNVVSEVAFFNIIINIFDNCTIWGNYLLFNSMSPLPLGYQFSSFSTYAVHKVMKWYPSEYWSLKNINCITSLRGRNEVEVKFENSMHNYNATLVHWHHTLGCQCSSFGSYAVHKVEPVKQPKRYWPTDGRTDGRTDGQTEIVNLIVG